jgi:hypothetical protein
VPLATVSRAPTIQAEPHIDCGTRLSSVDVFRGLIMVWMALDHTRDVFTNLRFEPKNINLTYGEAGPVLVNEPQRAEMRVRKVS